MNVYVLLSTNYINCLVPKGERSCDHCLYLQINKKQLPSTQISDN